MVTQGDTGRLTLGAQGSEMEVQGGPEVVNSTIRHYNFILAQKSLTGPRWPNATQGDSKCPLGGRFRAPERTQGGSGRPRVASSAQGDSA